MDQHLPLIRLGIVGVDVTPFARRHVIVTFSQGLAFAATPRRARPFARQELGLRPDVFGMQDRIG